MVWAVLGIIVFVILLLAFPRAVLAIVGVAAAGILLVIWGISDDEKKRKAAIDDVKVTVVASNGSCDPSRPLLITIKNDHSKRIDAIRFRIEPVRIGYSGTGYSSYRDEFESRKIIAPGQAEVWCLNTPGVQAAISQYGIENLRFDVVSKYPTFADR